LEPPVHKPLRQTRLVLKLSWHRGIDLAST
jgi:hypothetical protein